MVIKSSNKFVKIAAFMVLAFQVFMLDAAPRGGSGLGTPSGLNLPSTSEDGNITLTWNAPIGAGNLTEYIIQESVNNGGFSVVGLSPHPTLSWTATGRGQGSYRYRVQACGMQGCSSFSSPSSSVNVLSHAFYSNCITYYGGLYSHCLVGGVVESDGDIGGDRGGSYPDKPSSPYPYFPINFLDVFCGYDQQASVVACETEVSFNNNTGIVLDGIVFDVFVSGNYIGRLSPNLNASSYSSTTLTTRFNFPDLEPGIDVITSCLVDPQNRITSDCWEYSVELLN